MQFEWYGQSAFRLSASDTTVAIDPFADLSGLRDRGLQFDYPPIEGLAAELLLVTHEHADHNGVDAVGGDPVILRSTAGRLASPIGEITAVASEHDQSAGTERGPNTIFAFELEGLRVCHVGACPGRCSTPQRFPTRTPRSRWSRRSPRPRSTPAAPQPTAISDTWVSRMWLPDGSRNDESIP
jgi:hypothetical protein